MAKYTIIENGETHQFVRYFITSLTNLDEFADSVRKHWFIENKLHWCLDMDFGQDHMQIKNRNYLRNCEMLSRIALNVMRLIEPKFRRPGCNEQVAISNVKLCLDGTLDRNITTVANLFVEGKI